MLQRFWRYAAAAFLLVALGTGLGCQPPDEPEPQPPLEGFADYHNHQFAYLGFGGTAISHSIHPSEGCIAPLPFDPATFRVVDLVRNGIFARAKDLAALGHCQPRLDNVASQRVDTENLKRAWQYGLRLMVMMALNSEFMCNVAQLANPCPTDRAAIDQQIQAAKALQDAIDTEAGGPGLGWYRIVTSPQEARDVVKANKLAVVLGVEAAHAYGCRIEQVGTIEGRQPPLIETAPPPREPDYETRCNDNISEVALLSGIEPDEAVGSQITQKALALFEHYWRQGVRHFYPIHHINGVAGGAALSETVLHALNDPSGSGDAQINRVISAVRPRHASFDCKQIYPFDGGRCNSEGLSDTGRQLVRLMAGHGAVIDVDHTSWRSRRELLDTAGLLGGHYPMISSHSGVAALLNEWTNSQGEVVARNNEAQLREADIAAIIQAGGAFAPRLPTAADTEDLDSYPDGTTVAPHGCGGTTESWVQTYRYLADRLRNGKLANGKPAFVGVGIGTDMGPPIPFFAAPRFLYYPPGRVTGEIGTPSDAYLNLLHDLAGGPPEPPPGSCYSLSSNKPRVEYPFRRAGVEFPKSTTPWDGRATQPGYDISTDGIIHIGMLPDFVEELRALDLSDDDLQPLWHGAEAYIRAWEAAEAWRDSFNYEGTKGIRATCEAERAALLAGEDGNDAKAVVTSLRRLRDNGCRSNPYPPKPLTVAQAVRTTGPAPVSVTGYLIDDNRTIRLCNAKIDGPVGPLCAFPALAVDGETDAALLGQRVTLFGDVEELAPILTLRNDPPSG